jgi:hypothetical protein
VNPLYSDDKRSFEQQKIDKNVAEITKHILENIGPEEMLMRAKRFIYFLNHNSSSAFFGKITFEPKIEFQTIDGFAHSTFYADGMDYVDAVVIEQLTSAMDEKANIPLWLWVQIKTTEKDTPENFAFLYLSSEIVNRIYVLAMDFMASLFLEFERLTVDMVKDGIFIIDTYKHGFNDGVNKSSLEFVALALMYFHHPTTDNTNKRALYMHAVDWSILQVTKVGCWFNYLETLLANAVGEPMKAKGIILKGCPVLRITKNSVTIAGGEIDLKDLFYSNFKFVPKGNLIKHSREP